MSVGVLILSFVSGLTFVQCSRSGGKHQPLLGTDALIADRYRASVTPTHVVSVVEHDAKSTARNAGLTFVQTIKILACFLIPCAILMGFYKACEKKMFTRRKAPAPPAPPKQPAIVLPPPKEAPPQPNPAPAPPPQPEPQAPPQLEPQPVQPQPAPAEPLQTEERSSAARTTITATTASPQSLDPTSATEVVDASKPEAQDTSTGPTFTGAGGSTDANLLEETKPDDNLLEETQPSAPSGEPDASTGAGGSTDANLLEETKPDANLLEETKPDGNLLEETQPSAPSGEPNASAAGWRLGSLFSQMETVAADAEDPEALPPNWFVDVDPTSNAEYYYNSATGESAWQRPGKDSASDDTVQDERDLPIDWYQSKCPSSGVMFYHNDVSGEVQWDHPLDELPEGWDTAIDPTYDTKYYFNVKTGEVSWEAPAKIESAATVSLVQG